MSCKRRSEPQKASKKSSPEYKHHAVMHGAFNMPKRILLMHEHQKTLSKIEQLVDQLPYKWVKIQIETKNQTLVLEKERPAQIGFIKNP